MSDYIRPRVGGASIFFTVTLAERGSRLLFEEIGLLREAVREILVKRPVTVEAWVVLPDHMHCVWTMPEGDAEYGMRWGAIKARFSRNVPAGRLRASHVARRERGVWQRRFWEHHIRDETDFRAHFEYCWTNPVKHGFVARAEDWPYSSYHRDKEKWS